VAINSTEAYQEAFVNAFEQRSEGYQDLVSNANVLLFEMKERGGWETFSGPTIRETLLYNESGTYIRYSGFGYLNPQPAELFNDAVFLPKQAAVSVTMSMEQILKNDGPNQIRNVYKAHMDAAEEELKDRFTEDLHSAGAEPNQIGGLQMAIPTTPTNSYGGIDRNTYSIWRTTTYDANSQTIAGTAITAVTSATIKPLYNYIVIKQSKGRKGPNLILASEDHFLCYSAATEAIQRVTDNTKYSALGFTSLKYFGGGRSMDIVLEGGQGTAMPAAISYIVDAGSLKFRYHPDRNFTPFGGKQRPINQDAVVQHIGIFGNLTMNNPRHNAKLYDSA
jgi:hypothetical protein